MRLTKPSSQLRQDLVTGDWVVVASNRSQRPDDFIKSKFIKTDAATVRPTGANQECLFCQIVNRESPLLVQSHGREISAPPFPDWTIAVVNNKYPAFSQSGRLRQRKVGPYQEMSALGFHELVVTRNHSLSLGQMAEEDIKEIFSVYQKRYRHLAKQNGVRYVAIFHNQGPKAGASIKHPHSQIIAIPITDADIDSSLNGTKRFWQEKHRCPHCEIIKHHQKRLVWENQQFVILCPFAPKSAFTLQIYPKDHQAYFEKASSETVRLLAQSFQVALKSLEKGLNNPDYNFFLRTAPCDRKNYDFYHWHWQIMPKTQIWAGFELGAGIEISTITPEDTAAYLKKQL